MERETLVDPLPYGLEPCRHDEPPRCPVCGAEQEHTCSDCGAVVAGWCECGRDVAAPMTAPGLDVSTIEGQSVWLSRENDRLRAENARLRITLDRAMSELGYVEKKLFEERLRAALAKRYGRYGV